jgi:magnesium transporter
MPVPAYGAYRRVARGMSLERKEPKRNADSNAGPAKEKEPAAQLAEMCLDKDLPSAVCVALPHGGKPIKIHSRSPAELISTLQSSDISWVDFTVSDLEKEGSDIAVKLGFSSSVIPIILKGYYASLEDRNTEMGIMVPAVKVSGFAIKTFPLLILLRKDLIVTIHQPEVERLVQWARYADSFIRKLPVDMSQENKMTMMLVRILDENNNHNFEHLRDIEEQADGMSKMLLDPKTSRMEIGNQIYDMKHTLITYLNTLWRTLDVLHSLRFGDAELISEDPKMLSQLQLLVEDVNRQIGLSEHMSEVLASGLEVLQTLYNNQLQILNNRMALTMTWLTILGTAVLVPNTLATIFGFVFNVETPELIWSLSVMVFATVGATYLAYWWVRRWVRLPTSPQ